jgi:hypothetical protein
MKCPKCSYVSHDYLNACRKCRVDLLGFKAQMQLHVVRAGHIDLRSVLSGVQPNSMTSGEYDLGESLFDSPMLVESQAEDGFDISLEDDFSFTPSSMSLESLDGFEVSNLETAVIPERPRPAAADSSDTATPETGYATVMMDISGLSDEAPPSESDRDMVDAPTGLSSPALDAPIEFAEAAVEPPALPVDDATIAPDPTAAEPRSAASEEELGSNPEPMAPELYSGNASEHVSDSEKKDAAATKLQTMLPESFPTEGEGMDALNDESGDLILPSLDTDFVSDEDPSSAGSAADAPEASFTMPDLPDLDTDEKPATPNSEEISLDINPLDAPELPPIAFPSLQSVISPMPTEEATGSPKPDDAFLTATSEEATLADEHPSPLPVEPAGAEPGADASFASSGITYELDISDIQAPDEPSWPHLSEQTEAPMAPSPNETTIVDEPSPFASTGHIPTDFPIASSETKPDTLELDIGDIQAPDEPSWPHLSEQTEAPMAPSPNETTIVDEPSPFASTGHPTVDPTVASPDAVQPDASEEEDHLDLQSLFPDEQPPKKRD